MKTIPLLLCLTLGAAGQEKKIKSGLSAEDWTYTLAPGVAQKEVTLLLGSLPDSNLLIYTQML
jgi:hypothetical protein